MHIQGFMQSQSSLICFCGVEFLLQTFAIKCVIKNYVNVGRFRLSFELAFECIRSYELRIKVEFLKIPRINGVNSSLFTINIYVFQSSVALRLDRKRVYDLDFLIQFISYERIMI